TSHGKLCNGLSRRDFLTIGALGVAGLGWGDLLKLQAQMPTRSTPKSVIMVYLFGGPSHMDTYDLKPNAPAEYRGEFRPTRTNVPGLDVCEHLPRLARLADRFALVRSLHHDSPGHVNSTHTVLTGYPGEPVERPPYRPKSPDFG